MNEVDQFKDRLIVTLKEMLELGVPPVDNEEFAVFKAVENIIDLIRSHP